MTEPLPEFSDAGDESIEPAVTSEGEPEVEPTRRRGRPRSQETIVRDQLVLDALAQGPLSKDQLVEKLDEKPELVYLSLWRLKRDGRVARVVDGTVRHAWQLT